MMTARLDSTVISRIPPESVNGASRLNPDGYTLDAPFAIAGGVREITVESKRAIIIQ